MPVTQAERSALTVTRTRPPSEEAVLAASAARAGDLTRLVALRARRARAAR